MQIHAYISLTRYYLITALKTQTIKTGFGGYENVPGQDAVKICFSMWKMYLRKGKHTRTHKRLLV